MLSSRSPPFCIHRRVILTLSHPLRSRARCHKSSGRAIGSPAAGRGKGALYRNATPLPNRWKAPCAWASDGHDGRPFVRCNGNAPAGSSMICLVLVTHGRLAAEFRSALEHVVGPQKQIEAVTIWARRDVAQRRTGTIHAG